MKKIDPTLYLKRILSCLILVLVSVVFANAQTVWRGGSSNKWSVASNWSTGKVPTSADSVVIGSATITNQPTVDVAAVCRALTVGVTNAGSLTVNYPLTVSGSVTINSNGTLNHGASQTLTLTGNWTCSGNYYGQSTSSVVFAGSSQTINGSNVDFKNVVVNAGSTVLLNANVNADVSVMVNGTWDPNEGPAGTGTYALMGSASATVGATGTAKVKAADANSNYQMYGTVTIVPGGTVDYASTKVTQTIYSSFSYDNLKISGSGTKRLSGDYAAWNTSGVDVGNVTVMPGCTLDLNNYSLSRGNTGGTLTVNNGATLRIGGANSLPVFLNYSFGTTSTVEYYGSPQTITPGTYGNLLITGTGTKTAGGALTVNDFTLNTATFVGGSYTHRISSDWLMTSGTFTNTGTTIQFTGSADQTISSTGAFNNLVMNKSGGTTTLNSDITVNGVLTFTSGNITTGTYKVISTGSVARTSGHVVGKLQKAVPKGSNLSYTFEVGDATGYAPVTTTFSSVTIAGSLTVSATGGNHANVGTSNVDQLLDLNHYWTIANSGISFNNYSATFNYTAADMSAGAVYSYFIAGRYNAGWTYPTVGNRTATSLQVTGLTSSAGFGDFVIGEDKQPVSISYAGAPFCSNAAAKTVTLSGRSGGTYTVTPTGLALDATTGTITPSSSAAGSYTVTYTRGSMSGIASIAITAAPSATISYAGPFCKSVSTAQAVTRTGTGGGTYSAAPAGGLTLDASTGAITPSTSTPGTYTVTYKVAASGPCAAYTTTTTVTITAAPSATISYSSTPFCGSLATAQAVTQTGTPGGTYSSTVGLTIDPASGAITPSSSTPGTYTVTYTIAGGGCATFTATTSITITAAPSATIAYSAVPYCTTGTANVALTGTAGGIFSSTPAGLSLDATSGAIALSASTPGSYTVTYTIAAAGGCQQLQTSAPVVVGKATWNGTVNTDWSTAANWSCAAQPTVNDDVLIPSGIINNPVISGSRTGNVNNLTIQAGTSLTVNNATLNIAGAVSSQGTLTASNAATVQFSGTAAQTIPASLFAGNTVYNLTNNNKVSLTLQGPLDLTNVLLLNDGVLYTNGYLTLKSSATNTARVGTVLSAAANPIIGDVTVERYVPGRRKYRLMAPSVTTSSKAVLSTGEEGLSIWGQWQNGGVATPGVGTWITGGTAADGFDTQTSTASLYTYNDATRRFVAFSSANGKKTKYTPLQTGKAYYMFVYGDRINSVSAPTPNATVLKTKGTLAVGQLVFSTTSATPLTATVGNFALIGNPYACAIDWKSVQRSGVSNTIWGWDANLNSTGGYVTVTTNGTSVIVSPISNLVKVSRYIQPGQGFFVQTLAGNPQVSIQEKDKNIADTTVTTAVFRTADAGTPPLMAVNLLYTSAGAPVLADGAVAAFDPSFSTAVTAEEDGLKMTGSAETIGLTESGNLLSIDSRPLPQSGDTLAVTVARLTKTQYTLEIFGQNLNSAASKAYLYDAYLNTQTPLSLTDTNRIVFNVVSADAASSAAGRFRIVFGQNSPLPVTFTGINAVRKDGGVSLNWNVAFEETIERYEVERSTDGRNFSKVGEVAASHIATASYQWFDASPAAGNNWYRVRSMDVNGGYGYSKTVMAIIPAGNAALAVYPNPVHNQQINVQLKDLEPCAVTAYLFDRKGTEVLQQAIDHAGGTAWYRMAPQAPLAGGVYVLKIVTKNKVFSQMVMLE